MSGTDGQQPEAVPARPGKRAGEAGLARPTAEPPIWTARMLATLDKGVTGGKWYSPIDKLYPETTLRTAFKAVAANRGAAGVDHVSIEHYAEDLDANLTRLSEALRTGTYRPQAIRRHYIEKHVLGPAGACHCEGGGPDPGAGKPGEAATGDSDHTRPRGADGIAHGVGTHPSGRGPPPSQG